MSTCDEGLFLRVTRQDLDRLAALSKRVPIASRAAIAREAMRIGLDAIEHDPAVLVTRPLPKRGGAPR